MLDREQFNELARSYYNKLWEFAYGYVKSEAIAEEIVQDVFLNLWAGREKLAIRESMDVYLFGSVRNRAIKHIKHEQVVMKQDDESFAPPSQPLSPDEQLEWSELDAIVERAIESLPQTRREAITLHWRHEMTHEEIATILGTSPGAVRTMISRTRAQLAGLLARFR